MPWRPDELFVGLVALALVPLIAWRIVRGVRAGRLPIYRTYLHREESASKWAVLLAIHGLTLVLAAVIAADLLLNLGLREML